MTEHEHNSTYSEDTSSLSEEERIKKLFQAFNSCADGLIDSQDLLSICQEFNIEGTVEELTHEIGIYANGRISFSQLLQQQSNAKHDIEPLNNSQQLDYPASSNNSLGVPSGSKNDRWEFDSGARDLSPEPHTVQKFMEVVTAGASSNSTNSSNLLHLANKLHLAALASLRSEILDLSTRLQTVTQERDLLEKSLVQSQSVIEASIAQQYEERLRRLQSVIAELSLKSDNGQLQALDMPDEEDGGTLSVEDEHVIDYLNNFQDVSVDNNSLLCNNSNDVACNTTDTLLSDNRNEEIVKHSPEKLFNRKKVKELMQNIIELQAENARLHSKLSTKDVEIKKLRSSFISTKENQHSKARDKHSSRVQNERTIVTPSLQNPPVPKVAERVRLRRMDRHVTGSDIASLGVSHTEVAEHLVSSVLEQCNLLEIGSDHRKFEIETERLISKLEHTRAFNTLLQSSLEEVKSYCERLTLLVGKYENNAIALQLALGCSDRVIRAYEELVTLMSNGNNENYEIEEKHLIQLIDDLKKERFSIEGAVVQLESYVEPPAPLPQIPTQARKLDLETAVLIQEVMSMREEKADLNAKIYRLEKDKESLELKLTTMETQQQTQLATVQHLKVLHESIPENQDRCSEIQKEKILRDQLKEMAATVEHVSRNAEARQKQHAEMMVELRTTNSSLLKTIEKNKHKYEARLHRLEAQMLTMVSRHAAQVQALKQRIFQLLGDKNKEHQW